MPRWHLCAGGPRCDRTEHHAVSGPLAGLSVPCLGAPGTVDAVTRYLVTSG
jgi:hypothetical protein